MNKPKNIIILCIDALRFDCLGVEENKTLLKPYKVEQLINTPTLDSISKEGIRFSQAVSAANVTTTSLASLMTGLYPPHHGVRRFFKHKLNSEAVTLAQILKENGYITINGDELCALPLLEITTRGMDFSYHSTDPKLWECIQQNAQKNVFLFLHMMDVHDPYLYSFSTDIPEYNDDYNANFELLIAKEKTEPFNEEYPYTLTYQRIIQSMFDRGDIGGIFKEYIRGVNKFDTGRFAGTLARLKDLGMLDDSLLIIMADHGEGPGKSHFGHATELYDGVVRIPLIMTYPGVLPEKKVMDMQVRSVDIFPTIAAFSGLSVEELNIPYDIDGKNLLPLLAGESEEEREAYFELWSHSGSGGDMISILSQSWKKNDIITSGLEWRLYQRGLRTPAYKCILNGDDFKEEQLDFNAENEEFVRSAYRKILRRKEDLDGFNHHFQLLESNKLDRTDLIEGLKNSEEYQILNILFDLQNDPLETTNLLRNEPTKKELHIFNELSAKIEQIEKTVSITEPEEVTFQSKEELQKIEHRLKALGYL